MTDRQVLLDAISYKQDRAENELANAKQEWNSVLKSTHRTPEEKARELIRLHARVRILQQDIIDINQTFKEVYHSIL